MNPIRINLEQLKNKTIPIGREGENEYTIVRIDCGKVFREHPQAEVSMKVKPPKGIVYPVTVEREGNEIVWTVHDYDLASKGDGQFQLTFTDGTVICKTAIGRTLVLKSLEGNGPAPTPIDDWMQEAQEALDAVEDAEVNQPVIGEDGYWYTWNQEAGEYQKTDKKAEGQNGEDGHTPVLTSSKSGKTTTIYADGDQLAQIQDGQDANIDDTSTAADKVWSAAKSNTLLSALTSVQNDVDDLDEQINGTDAPVVYSLPESYRSANYSNAAGTNKYKYVNGKLELAKTGSAGSITSTNAGLTTNEALMFKWADHQTAMVKIDYNNPNVANAAIINFRFYDADINYKTATLLKLPVGVGTFEVSMAAIVAAAESQVTAETKAMFPIQEPM